MAEGNQNVPDISEMFQRMGEKLGWFKNIDQEKLPRSTKKKKTKPHLEAGSEQKPVRRKEHSTKSTKVRKKVHEDKTNTQGSTQKIISAQKDLPESQHSNCKMVSSHKHIGDCAKLKAVLDFNFSSSEDEEIKHYPVKRTHAHTNLPAALCSAVACGPGPDYGSGSESDRQGNKDKAVSSGFGLSSSEDEIGPQASSALKLDKMGNNVKTLEHVEMDPRSSVILPKQKPVKGKVSDSFAEKVDIADTFVSCVSESYVEQEFIPDGRKNSDGVNLSNIHIKENKDLKIPSACHKDIFSVDDTIVQKPVHVSIESFSPEIDITFGEPPCESTRIHRRSSVSYKKLLGSPDELNSSAIVDDTKLYKTCVANVSDLSDEAESPVLETALEMYKEKTDDNSNIDTKLRNTVNKIDDTSADTEDAKNLELCKGLQELGIHHQSLNNSKHKSFRSEKSVSESSPETNRSAIDQSFDESIEVVDAYTQTDFSFSDNSLSPLKQSDIRTDKRISRKASRKKSENSDGSITDNGNDTKSDISEVEVKEMSIQTDMCLNLSVEEANMNKTTKNAETTQGYPETFTSHKKDQNEIVLLETSKIDLSTNTQQKLCDAELFSDMLPDSNPVESEKSAVSNNEKDNPEYEENASNISDVDSTGESNNEEDGLSSETSNNISNSENGREQYVKLNSPKLRTHKIGRSVSAKSDVTKKSEKCSNYSTPKDGSSALTEVNNVTQNTWRQTRVSESSSDDDLEAYFEKLRNPKKPTAIKSSSSSSEASPVSMKDFIVEDDEMSSESDDGAFYVREDRKLEETPCTERLKGLKSTKFVDFSDSDESDFSTDRYPGSVTKHKKRQTTRAKTRSKSWSFSDEDKEEIENDMTSKSSKKKTSVQRAEKDRKMTDSKSDVKKKSNVEKYLSKDDSDVLPEPTEEILFKTPKPLTRVAKNKADKENGTQGIFKTPKSSHKIGKSSEDSEMTKAHGMSRTEKMKFITLSDSDYDDDDDNVIDAGDDSTNLPDLTPSVLKEISANPILKSKSLTDADLLRTPSSVSKGSKLNFFTPQPVKSNCSFLKSLSGDVQDHRRDPKASRFVNGFKKTKEELSQHLFHLYNESVFENQLPRDLPIEWNKRLLRTAGYCTYKKSSKNAEDRSVKIELSTKVCDSAERVRDTLIHELCHAAVWLINGTRDGHGRFWKYWARKSNHVHPEIPVIARCHDYSINTKYTYTCTQCGYSIGRHSKSLDTEKKVCGYCHGQFKLLQNSASLSSSQSESMTSKTPRTPNRFAMYVKEHYGAVKKKNNNLKHGDVMKELSRQFAEMNKI